MGFVKGGRVNLWLTPICLATVSFHHQAEFDLILRYLPAESPRALWISPRFFSPAKVDAAL